MASNFKRANATVSAEADAVCALADGGFLEIYTGRQPATADTPIGVRSQLNLATLRFATPAFGPATAGVALANAIDVDPRAYATGQATWFRVFRRGHTPGTGDEPDLRVWDGTIATTDADLNLNSTAIRMNAIVTVTTLTYTATK